MGKTKSGQPSRRERVFRIRIRLSKSQRDALHAAAESIKMPFETFLRTCAMRRMNRTKARSDPSDTVNIGVSAEEKLAIERAAGRSRVVPSQYIRESSLSAIADLVVRGAIQSVPPTPVPPEPHFARDRAPTYIPPAPRPSQSHAGKSEARPHSGPAPTQNRSIG